MAVYCKGCGRDFPQYKEVAQAIKDQIPWTVLEKAGPVVLTTVVLGPYVGALVLANDYQAVMDTPAAWKAFIGSRRDALNAAKFPCPSCGQYVRWKRRRKD